MKIDTNYIYYRANLNNNRQTQQPQVTFGRRILKPTEYIERASDIIALQLGKKQDDIIPLLKGANEKRLSFLRTLAQKYNEMYYYAPEKESSDVVLQLFKNYKEPHRQHFNVIHQFSGTFEQMNKVLKNLNSEKDYALFKKMQRSVFGERSTNTSMMLDIFASENRKEYTNHFADYVYYFRLNRNNKNAISDLDYLVKTGKYDKNIYEKEYFISRLYRETPEFADNEVLNKELISQYYSKAGIDFLNDMMHYLNPKVILSDNTKTDILDMYKTTTVKNGRIRASLFNYFKETYSSFYNYDVKTGAIDLVQNNNKANMERGLHILKNLYLRADNSTAAKNFLIKALKEPESGLKFEDLETILSVVPPKKAQVYYDNITRIFTYIKDPKQRMEYLESEIANPFFETADMQFQKKILKKYKIKTDLTFKNSLKRGVKNIIDRIRYTFSPKKPILELEQAPQIEAKNIPTIVEQTTEIINKPEPITIKTVEIIDKPEPIALKTAETIENPEQITNKSTENINESAEELTQKLNIVRNFKSERQQKKYQVMQEVNEIIKKRLGMKTVEKQQDDYEKNATKMRLTLLPEIFDSIKERRATDKLVGKTKGLSSNKDAVKLYKMINGKNKKLVNYMLKKRNVDGTRMYEVKDIINLLSITEKTIAKQKSINPEFKAKDAKLYYDNIHSSMINSYGKLQRPKTTSTIQK